MFTPVCPKEKVVLWVDLLLTDELTLGQEAGSWMR